MARTYSEPAPGKHDTGVVVTELVDACPASGDIPAAALVPDGLSDHPGLGKN